ncbi:hypothetical protein BGZ68_000616 [Mortierella alpina]|nr:hypothetical protein BGZ68_000616 [Mortierella alpina]
MGAGVSREHAKLPFGYTHARREEHSCSTLASSSLASRRQRLAHRLLLIKGSDSTTAITPLASHRLLLAEDGSVSTNGERTAAYPPTAPFSSSLSLALGTAEDDSDHAEIVSLSSILNEGPQVQLRWHAVGQDQELDQATHNGHVAMDAPVDSRTGARAESGPRAAAVDSDSGHDSCFPHSRSTTLDSMEQSSEGHACPHAMAVRLADPETAAALPLSSIGSGSHHFASAEILARQDALEEVLPSPLTTSATGTTAAAATTPDTASPAPPFIPGDRDNQPIHLQKRPSAPVANTQPSTSRSRQHHQRRQETAEQALTDEDSDCGGVIKGGDRKMDLIAALGIAEVPEDPPVHVPFDSFTEEPTYHRSVPNLHCIQPTSRRYNVRHYSGSHEIEPREYDHNGTGAHIPGGFFDGYRAPHDSDDEGLGEDMDADTEDENEGFGRIMRLKKGKGKRRSSATLSYSGHSLLDYSLSLSVDEDVAHLSPIPFSDLPSLTHIGLCSYGIVKLSCNIRLLSSATGLQICCNDLCSVPTEIGFLRNLTLLDLSKNSLTSLPDSIRYLTKLVDLRLSHNFIEVVPPAIGEFSKLTSLQLDNNRLERIPAQIGKIKGLAQLNLENNPITILPAEIGHLQYLRRLRIDNCPLLQRLVHSSVHSPPTLLELAARVVVRQRVVVPNLLPEHLRTYLKTSQQCSFCEGPYFETSFKRGKIIEKNNALIPLEYTLCMPHWNTERERIKLLFGPRLVTSPVRPVVPCKPTSYCPRRHAKSESSSGSLNGTDTMLGSPPPPLSLVGSPVPVPVSAPAGSGLVSLSAVPNVEVAPSNIHGCSGGPRAARRRSSSGSGSIVIGTAFASGSASVTASISGTVVAPEMAMAINSNTTGAAGTHAVCSPPAKSRFSLRLKPRGDRTLVSSP